MNIVLTNIYLFILATVLAILEIQIEGQHGWAKNLPAWRPYSSKWYVRLYSKIMTGKEFTGYHLFMFLFVLLIFHLPYVFGLAFAPEHWLKTLSYFFMFSVLWDFLWFVLNPYYPLKQFKKEHILWHNKWFWKAPIDYYNGILASFLIILPLAFFDLSFFNWWVVNIGLFGFQTLVVALFTLYILKIDKWHEGENNG